MCSILLDLKLWVNFLIPWNILPLSPLFPSGNVKYREGREGRRGKERKRDRDGGDREGKQKENKGNEMRIL